MKQGKLGANTTTINCKENSPTIIFNVLLLSLIIERVVYCLIWIWNTIKGHLSIYACGKWSE